MPKHIAALVAFCFTISIVWCGDFDCIQASAHVHIADLLGSPDGGHHASSSSDGAATCHSDDCTCLCHVPSITFPMTAAAATAPPVDFVADLFRAPALSAPARSVFRPPIYS